MQSTCGMWSGRLDEGFVAAEWAIYLNMCSELAYIVAPDFFISGDIGS